MSARFASNDFAPHREDDRRPRSPAEGYVQCERCGALAPATAPASRVCDGCYEAELRTAGVRT